MPVSGTKLAVISTIDAGLFSSPQKRRVVLCLLLAVITLLLYNSVTRHDFINFDDDRYVYDNVHVRSGLSWSTVTWALRSTQEANWHPVTWFSHALDVSLFGMNPAGHHYVNVLLHVINILLLFLLLERATGSTWRSLLVAAFFAVHPINVESVAWVAERKNLLCMLFFLLAVGAYGWYAQKPGIGRYALVAGLFALGLMSKPMVITFPFTLLLLDYWPLGRIGPSTVEGLPAGITPGTLSGLAHYSPALLFLEKVPLMMMSAASAIITMYAQKEGGAVRSLIEYSWPSRVANAVVSYAVYVGKGIWPIHLAAMYPHRHDSLPTWQVVGAAILLVAITASVLLLKRFRYLAVGWFGFLGIMVPVIGLVQVGQQAMADRYAYIPFLGLFVAAVWGVADLAPRCVSSRVLAAVAVAIVAAFLGVTRVQVAYWHDSTTLWLHTLSVTSGNFVAEDNLGEALVTQGRFEEAIIHFRKAALINATDPISQLNIGVYEKVHGQPEQAIQRYEAVLRLTSDQQLRGLALVNLGSAYRTMGNYRRARQNYEAALQLAPDSSLALIGMGLVSQKTGDSTHAVDYYSRAVSAQPTDVAYLLLAQALARAGRVQEAELASGEARRLSGDLSRAQQSVNHLLAE